MTQLTWQVTKEGYMSGVYCLYRVVHGFSVWKRGETFTRLGEGENLTDSMAIAEKDASNGT